MSNVQRFTKQALLASILFSLTAFLPMTSEVAQAQSSKHCFSKPSVCARLAMQERMRKESGWEEEPSTSKPRKKHCFSKPSVCARLAMQARNKPQTETVKTTKVKQPRKKHCFSKPAVCARLGFNK